MRKGFAPILLLVAALVLVSIAGGAFYLTNTPKSFTPAETVNWKTYTAERSYSTSHPEKKYKYTVKYLPDWTFQEANATTFFLPPGETYIKDKTPKGISISVRDKNTPVNPVFIEYRTIRKVEVENETVNILQAKNLASEQYLAEVKRDNYIFRFSFSFGLDRIYDSIFDQSLSTFKFIE